MDLFDLEEGRRRKEKGMAQAANNRADMLDAARDIAWECVRYGDSICTTDIIAETFSKRGLDYSELGLAAGSIFKGKKYWAEYGGKWVFTGKYVPTKRAVAHAREIKVWRFDRD